MASLFRSIERSTPGSPPLAVRLVLSSERVKCMRRTGPARPGLATPFSASASSSRPGTTNRVRVVRTWHPAWTSSSSSSSSSPSSVTRLSRYRTAVGVHSTEPMLYSVLMTAPTRVHVGQQAFGSGPYLVGGSDLRQEELFLGVM
ncbi:hypothetical protein L210DRAFT_3544975, partial [Boletus edulis BED1]